MLRKFSSLILITLLIHTSSYVSRASSNPKEKVKEAMLAAEVKAGIAHLGTGTAARVRVKLRDKTSYNGYISEIGEDYFVVTDAKTGATAPIAYPEVKGVKGNNFSTGAKIGIGVAIAAAVAIAIAVIANDDDDFVAPPLPCDPGPCRP